jgi:thiamine-monophosphate kinase
MSGSSELERIARLARALGVKCEGVEVGIGDDAAVLAIDDELLVWTIDAQVEGTHFRRELISWRDVGWRATMAAASDLAAMGARPWCALAALALPSDVDDAAFDAIAAGQRAAADAIGAAIVGGNLARATEVSLTTTLLGRCARAIGRDGARAGDSIWIAGDVGLAAAGLRALASGDARIAEDARIAVAVERWRTPRALVAEGLRMAAHAHAAIDVSDGLARDVAHVARASGVRVVIDADALLARAPALRDAAGALGVSAIDLALHGGEDYALVVASSVALDGFARIGDVREGAGVALREDGAERDLAPHGFDHFADV